MEESCGNLSSNQSGPRRGGGGGGGVCPCPYISFLLRARACDPQPNACPGSGTNPILSKKELIVL